MALEPVKLEREKLYLEKTVITFETHGAPPK